jgi:predicted nucleic acid-binding protein
LDFLGDTSRIVKLDFETAAEVDKITAELVSQTKDMSLPDLIILCTARACREKW